MSTVQQTLADVSVTERKRRLEWTPGNPMRATKPEPYEPTVRRYLKDPRSLPYEVPTEAPDDVCRMRHRTWYWLEHSFRQFICPDCGRGVGGVRGVHVHHKDEEPRNGEPDNLIALCGRCHRRRHNGEDTEPRRYVEEWIEAFADELGVER